MLRTQNLKAALKIIAFLFFPLKAQKQDQTKGSECSTRHTNKGANTKRSLSRSYFFFFLGCYGVDGESDSIMSSASENSTEPWFCDACKCGVSPSCELCPNQDGIFKETDAGRLMS